MSDWIDEIERIRRQRREAREQQEVEWRDHVKRIQQVVDQWDDTVKSLLEHIAEATWADMGCSWKIEHRRISHDTAKGRSEIAWYGSSAQEGFTVELVVDVKAGYLPREFVVRYRGGRLRAEPSLEDLKAALLEAYKAGPEDWSDVPYD